MLDRSPSNEGNGKFRYLVLLAVFAFATLAIGTLPTYAATFVVNTTNDTADATPGNGTCADAANQCSLRAAISEANALAGADIITLPAGTYTHSLVAATEDANAGGDYDITGPVTINGAGAGTTIVQANAAPDTATERVFHVVTGAGAVTLNGFTVRHGFHRFTAATNGGGGLLQEGATTNVTLSSMTFSNNTAEPRGGGVRVGTNGATMTITNSTLTNNKANALSPNVSNAAGAALDVAQIVGTGTSTVTMTNSTMSNNIANTNTGNCFGGAVISTSIGATLNFTNTNVTGNQCIQTTGATNSSNGGGLYNQNGTMNVTRSVVTGNTSTDFVGGIRALASAGTTITNIVETKLSNNTAAGAYAGFLNVGITGQTGETTMNIVRSEIVGNMATDADAIGGGGLNLTSGATGPVTLNVDNTTVANNTAPDLAGLNNEGATATMITAFVTVTGNVANNPVNAEGGGIWQGTVAGGSTFIGNTISAGNTAHPDFGPNLFGVINSIEYNHIGTAPGAGTTFTPGTGDVVGSDPNLGPLQNNGGLTLTRLPNPGSPVLNAIPPGSGGCGDPSIPTDQRGTGFPRLVGSGCDKGAAERGDGATPTPTPPATPTPTPTPPATPTPTPTPPATPTPTPTPPATPSPTPTPVASPTPSPAGTPLYTRSDYDGDNKTDLTVWRASGTLPPPNQNDSVFYTERSSNGSFFGIQFGNLGDVPVAGDFDGDNKTDFAVTRYNTSPGGVDIIYLESSTNTAKFPVWGNAGDIFVSGDYDGDKKTDVMAWRPSNGTWYIVNSSGANGGFTFIQHGQSLDKVYAMDTDGDGKHNLVYFRPSSGNWVVRNNDGSTTTTNFGVSSDIPVPADYDGDNKDDIAVFRDGMWIVLRSSNGQVQFTPFGSAGDVPVPGDYDGDNLYDRAVFRQGIWHMLRSTAGYTGKQFGASSDIPMPKTYIP